jgi:hypothetical protein
MATIAVSHDRTRRYGDDQVLTVSTVAVIRATGFPGLGTVMFALCHSCQGIGSRHGPQDDVAPFATVAAIGTATRDVFFPAEADYAPTTISSFDVNLDAIHKHIWFVQKFRACAGLMCVNLRREPWPGWQFIVRIITGKSETCERRYHYQLRRGKAAERKLTVRPGNKFTKLGQALPRPRGIPA